MFYDRKNTFIRKDTKTIIERPENHCHTAGYISYKNSLGLFGEICWRK